MVSTTPLVCVVIMKSNQVLLVEKVYDDNTTAYGLPSGKMEESDDPVRMALNAAEEKTGLKLKDVKDVGEYSAIVARGDGWVQTKRVIAFFAEEYEGNIRPSGRNRPMWISLDFLDNYNLLPNVKKIIMDAFNEYKLKTRKDVQVNIYS